MLTCPVSPYELTEPNPSWDLTEPTIDGVSVNQAVELDAFPAVHPLGNMAALSAVTLPVNPQVFDTRSNLDMPGTVTAAVHPAMSEAATDIVISSTLELDCFPGITAKGAVDFLAAVALAVIDQFFESKGTIDIQGAVSLAVKSGFSDGDGVALFFATSAGFSASATQAVVGAVTLMTHPDLSETTTAILNSGVSIVSLARALVDAGVSFDKSVALSTIQVFKAARKLRGEMDAFSKGTTVDLRPARTTSANLRTVNQRGGEPFEQQYGLTSPVSPSSMTCPALPDSMTEPNLGEL